MGTTREQIAGWFDRGVADSQDYLIVCCDTFDNDDYPVYATAATAWKAFKERDGKNMQIVMEVYDLRMDRGAQLAEHRAFHLPPRPREG